MSRSSLRSLRDDDLPILPKEFALRKVSLRLTRKQKSTLVKDLKRLKSDRQEEEFTICIVADNEHVKKADKRGLDYWILEEFEALEGQEERLRELTDIFDGYLVSDQPQLRMRFKSVLGKVWHELNEVGRLDSLSHDEDMVKRVEQMKAKLKARALKVNKSFYVLQKFHFGLLFQVLPLLNLIGTNVNTRSSLNEDDRQRTDLLLFYELAESNLEKYLWPRWKALTEREALSCCFQIAFGTAKSP